MTPQFILLPLMAALAFIGYARCFERMFLMTFMASTAFAVWVYSLHPPVPDSYPYWAGAGGLAGIAALLGLLSRRAGPQPEALAEEGSKQSAADVVVDGTNVIFWNGDANLQTLRAVVDDLKGKGMMPFVFLDASTRHHLGDPSLDERSFARALGLKPNRVMVCPARTEADSFILEFAQAQELPIVSNDRFADRAELAEGLKLIKGGVAGGNLMLHGV